MAVVYLAEDLKHERKVAVKVLRPELAATLGAERFLREIKLTANLTHPHILPLLDSGDADGFLFYVMPFVEGESLRERLGRERQLSTGDAIQIASEVADALGYAHGREIVHRDIKPENILIEEGHAVVSDFGIARAITAAGGDALTETGLAVGTPSYMSPEQATGDEIDGRSDIYSLACVVYEMLAGEPPFTGRSAQAIIARHALDTPHSLRAVRSGLPQSVENTIARALAKAPADRYRTAGDFAHALLRRHDDGPTKPARIGRGFAIAATAAVIAVIGTLAVVLSNSAPDGGVSVSPTVAVLPVENLGAPEDEYFADGMTEEITNRLAGIGGLRVKARTSAKRFKGSVTPIREIGESLQVDYVLESTVRTERDLSGAGRVRVSPKLIRTTDDTHLWTHTFDARLVPGEIFGVQANIAEQVAAALNVTLLQTELDAVRAQSTDDSLAYTLYLRGRHLLAQRSPEGLQQSQRLFRSAIERDSSFAAAYAGLADAISLHNFHYSTEQGPASWEPAVAAARRAVELDPSLAEAYASLGLALMYAYWDWDGARRSYQRAVALDPDNAEAWYWFAEVDWAQGLLDSAFAKTARALDLDPVSATAHATHGISMWFVGNHREATEIHARTVELQPTFLNGRWFNARMQARTGQPQRARTMVRSFFEESDPNRRVDSTLVEGTVQAMTGRADLATTVRVVEAIQSYGLDNTEAALIFGSAGFADSAFARLDVAINRRSEQLPVFLNYLHEVLGGDPRWDPMLARMGLFWR